VELIRAALEADLHVTDSRDPAALATWFGERARSYRTVIVAGGDGSLGVAYNVLAGRDVVIGYIPAGFGNATAHLLRLPRAPEALADVIREASTRSIDLVRVEGEGLTHLGLFAGTGWDAFVARRYADGGAHGLAGWGWAVAASLPDLWRRPTVKVTADQRLVYEGQMETLVAGTTPFFGRGLLSNPGARPDRGRLTARLYPGPAPAFAMELVRWVARTTARAAPMEASELEVHRPDGGPLLLQADGDVIGERSAWRFSIAPRATRLIGNW
jgi:diacylglycerol kinase (ATP)